MEDNLRLVSLVCCLLLIASLSAAESVTPDTKKGPSVGDGDIKETTAAQESASAQRVTPPPSPVAPKEEGGTEPPPKPSVETKQAPAGTETAEKGPAPASKPETPAKDDGEKALYSAEEAEKAGKEKVDIHKQVPKKTADKDESLFSIEEAEKAATDEADILQKQLKRKTVDGEGSLFSVEEAESAAGHEVASPKQETKKPAEAERPTEEKEEKKRSKVSLKRRKGKEKKEWTKIELGFAFKDVKLLQGSYSFETHFIGEMINNSDRDFGIVKYMFSAYNKRGKLITEEAFQITDFYRGQIKRFSGTIIDSYQRISSHKIRFLSAAPTSKG